MLSRKIAIAFILLFPIMRSSAQDLRITWDESTLRKLSPSSSRYAGYARMIQLADGKLFCVFENDGRVQYTLSSDNADHWSSPIDIALSTNGIAAAVPEVLQLHSGDILVSYNRRPTDAPRPEKKFGIELIRSSDNGMSWSKPITLYEAGHEFGNGCWEPAQIQLPSGEIQLYIANEGPYTQSNEQEISMFKSFDNGVTWSAPQKVSFRAKHRDGMPVPLYLDDTKEIIFSIEDNGLAPPEFKPAIIRSPHNENWSKAPVSGESKQREQPFDSNNIIPGHKYAGAPYIRRLKSGQVLLSYQSNEFRKDNVWDLSDMVVAIGDTTGRNFKNKTRPFSFTDPTKTVLWNSLCVAEDGSVIALGSTNAYGPHMEVWMIKGKVAP